jgi:hypothetical protein
MITPVRDTLIGCGSYLHAEFTKSFLVLRIQGCPRSDFGRDLIRRQPQALADRFSVSIWVLEKAASGPSGSQIVIALLRALSLTHRSTFLEQVRVSAFNDVDKPWISHAY